MTSRISRLKKKLKAMENIILFTKNREKDNQPESGIGADLSTGEKVIPGYMTTFKIHAIGTLSHKGNYSHR